MYSKMVRAYFYSAKNNTEELIEVNDLNLKKYYNLLSCTSIEMLIANIPNTNDAYYLVFDGLGYYNNTKTSNQLVTDAMRIPLIGDCLLVKNINDKQYVDIDINLNTFVSKYYSN